MHLINVIKDGELQIHIFNRSNFFYAGFKSGGTPDLKIQVYPLNSRGLERKQVRLQLQQHFIFRLLHLYTHYIIDRQISDSILPFHLLNIRENEGVLDVVFLDLQELIQSTVYLIILTRLDFERKD